MSESSRRSWLRQALVSGTWIAVLVAGVLVLNYVSSGYHGRWDVTSEKRFTLSDSTRSLLRGLDRDVVLTFFPRRTAGGEEHSRHNRRAIKDLLREYAARSESVSFRILPAEHWPDRIEHLAETYNLDERTLSEREPVLVTLPAAGSHRLIQFQQLRALRAAGDEKPSGVTVSFSRAERHLTAALYSLIRDQRRVVCFTTGHGERVVDPDSTNPSLRGFHSIAHVLREQEGFRVRTIDLSQEKLNASDVDVLVIADPEKSFSKKEQKRVDRYLSSGGSVVLLVEPWMKIGLDPVLSRFGIRVTDQRLMSPGQGVSSLLGAIRFNDYAEDHPVTAPLRSTGLPVFMRSVRILEKRDPSTATEEAIELLRSGPGSWGESSREAVRRRTSSASVNPRGPFPVALASSKSQTSSGVSGASGQQPSRLVVFGDADWLSNRTLESLRRRANAGNLDLFLNTVRWLTGLTEEIRVSPSVHHNRIVLVTREQAGAIFTLVVILVPGFFCVLGVSVWWFRRVRM